MEAYRMLVDPEKEGSLNNPVLISNEVESQGSQIFEIWKNADEQKTILCFSFDSVVFKLDPSGSIHYTDGRVTLDPKKNFIQKVQNIFIRELINRAKTP